VVSARFSKPLASGHVSARLSCGLAELQLYLPISAALADIYLCRLLKMFEIDEDDFPIVRTRKALLALDLQNDIISTGGVLSVENPPNFVENAVDLAVHFRDSGNDVIWVRSIFERSRPVNASSGQSETVITDRELHIGRRVVEAKSRSISRRSQKLPDRYTKLYEAGEDGLEDFAALRVDDNKEGDITSETFLTIEPGENPQIVLPGSPGANFSPFTSQNIDTMRDLVFQKSYYSAFKDGTLVQTLRAKFVTEIYLCGALTNISIFATAMDAARHGYSITIVDDCLGYRSKDKHDEALRQLTEFTGCDIISSKEVLQDLPARTSKGQQAPSLTRTKYQPKEKDLPPENLMADINLTRKDSSSSRPLSGPTEPPLSSTHVETAGNSESRPKEHEDINTPVVSPKVDSKKKERVKSKVKFRQRPSKSTPKDGNIIGESKSQPGVEKGHISQTPDSSQATSQVSKIRAGASDAAESPNRLKGTGAGSALSESVAVELGKGKELSEAGIDTAMPPDDLVEVDSKTSMDGESAPICEGDTTVINNLLDGELSKGIFEKLRDEVRWQKMSHRGGDVPRLVAVQGELAKDGSIPIYRHPADESPPLLPFSSVVSQIRVAVEEKLGHRVNHVLIQFYRDGNDYISEHSDKTLDILPNTFIANVSLGAQRTMVFRTKKISQRNDGPDYTEGTEFRKACRAPLPHNSMCKVGLVTNMRWLHGIRQDKRMRSEKSEAELAYDGGRISLTFRKIGTFLDKDQQKIWGHGATSKTKDDAKMVVNGETPDAEKMVRAFGQENHASEFNWAEVYGGGFDVLHISNSPKLFLSGDIVVDRGVRIMLAEYGIAWTEGGISPSFSWKDDSSALGELATAQAPLIKFMDSDLSRSTVEGHMAIMLYLDAIQGSKTNGASKSHIDIARQFTRLQRAGDLLQNWRRLPLGIKQLERELDLWESFAEEGLFIAGSTISVVDFAIIPLFIELQKTWPRRHLQNLDNYVLRMLELDSVKTVLGSSSHLHDPKTA
jgi:nicotinamidase-related amidase/glutathione S-transferase